MGTWLRLTALIGAVVLPVACGGTKPSPDPEPDSGDVGIEVENQSSYSLTIYLVTGSIRHRLGQVNAQDAIATVKPFRELTRGSSFYLRAEVIGSDDRVVTENLRVQPGQIVHWVLAPTLSMSRVVLY